MPRFEPEDWVYRRATDRTFVNEDGSPVPLDWFHYDRIEIEAVSGDNYVCRPITSSGPAEYTFLAETGKADREFLSTQEAYEEILGAIDA